MVLGAVMQRIVFSFRKRVSYMNRDLGQRIEKLVIEGGPCAGKSTGIPRIRKALKALGWMVLISREVPTALVEEHDYVLGGEGQNISLPEFQNLVLSQVIRQEDELMERARKSREPKVVILCDRGRYGGLGYMDHDDFYKMAQQSCGQSKDALFTSYSGCIFLTSPAVDKPDVYISCMSGNPARRETDPRDAALQNQKSLDACVGVSRMIVIDNSGDFEQKMQKAVNAVLHFLGNKEYEQKWATGKALSKTEVIELFKQNKIHTLPAAISQAYLKLSPEDRQEGIVVRRVRAVTLDDPAKDGKYILTLKGEKIDAGGQEEEDLISEVEYQQAISQYRDPELSIIEKTRFYFVYDWRYFELDIFEKPADQAFILELEHLPGEDLSGVALPNFLGQLRNVTSDGMYANNAIARKK